MQSLWDFVISYFVSIYVRKWCFNKVFYYFFIHKSPCSYAKKIISS